ncbi:hypothetical protein [Streptomyces tsukubensis]|uniref:hypothetical protein n=1 Tax=Streptomyces tsukubensis TaxID=83656 RepID=UPI00344EDF74
MTDDGGVAIALEALRGAVNTGFARLEGRLDGVLQRTAEVEKDIEVLKAEVETLKARTWRLVTLASAASAGGATGLVQLWGP